jgi:hypothetical protein
MMPFLGMLPVPLVTIVLLVMSNIFKKWYVFQTFGYFPAE